MGRGRRRARRLLPLPDLRVVRPAWLGKGFPYGTLFVNVLGSFIMGLLVGAIKMNAVPFIPWHDFIGEGFLGALTTFSTFSMDTFAAFRDGQPGKAIANVVVNMVLCLCGTAFGFFLMVQ